VVISGSSTMLRAMAVWARCPAEPSRSTMALTRWLPIVGAMAAIIKWGMNADDTRHRPERSARTGAPDHTRTALPRSPTGRCRKDVPARLYPEHEDENGVAVMMAVVSVTVGAYGAVDVIVGVPVSN
jgi:hypothetical protein